MKVSPPTITVTFDDGSTRVMTLPEAAELSAQLAAVLPLKGLSASSIHEEPTSLPPILPSLKP